jgi:hypothetical protein
MKRLAVTFALACTCLALAGPAQAGVSVGVADDRPLGMPDGGAAFFALMNDVGLREVRLTVRWDPAHPETIEHQAQIESVLPVAALRGIRVVVGVMPIKARSVTSSPEAPAQFAAFLQLVARTFPAVKDVIVGNEPNLSRYWQPQFDARGRGVSAGAYEALLARAYDGLKAVDPSINVIGVALSPRGGDNPSASRSPSTSPVKFLQGLGAAYRASGRRAPLMDELAFHPYPRKDTDPLLLGYDWPNAGVRNLNRIKQAFWDAFGGTGQPTFEEGLRVKLDEVGWQVAIAPEAMGAYFGVESVVPTNEWAQAAIYSALIRYVACDPSVESVLFFGLADEPNLDRWQAGLMRADGSRRPSYDAVKTALAETGGNCAGRARSWRHSRTVDGANAVFPNDRRLPTRVVEWSFLASAAEDAVFEAGLYRLAGSRRAGRALGKSGQLNARVTRFVRFPSRRLPPGRYVYSIRFRAAANRTRTRRITSRPFTVFRPR